MKIKLNKKKNLIPIFCLMAKVIIFGLMERVIMVIGKTTKDLDMENMNGLMVVSIKDFGKMIFGLVKVHIQISMVYHSKAFGMIIRF